MNFATGQSLTRPVLAAALLLSVAAAARGQAIGARKTTPNLPSNLDTPLRYTPDSGDFVITNGSEFFNRPLYGGNTAFRCDAGDKPEFILYLPGRGGNLRLGIRATAGGGGAKWLQDCNSVTARYRPGGMLYDIKDPLLGTGTLHIQAYALAATEGLILNVQGENAPAGVEWLWAFGGANGQRGARDGDIGTERVPISEYFQLVPDNCRGDKFTTGEGSFTMTFPLSNNPVNIFGRVPGDARPALADARQWTDPAKLFASAADTPLALPVITGHAPLTAEAQFLSLQRLGTSTGAPDLQTVTGDAPETAPVTGLLPAFKTDDLPKIFTAAESHFAALRNRVSIDTPDPYLNAAAGALNIAADAVWDEPQKAIMHGAVAWRQKLLGWRGPYSLDDLGWHDRATENFATWISKQNVKPIPQNLPGADESSNLARSEAALHTNGDMSNSHYDMNMVHIDAAFRHILWTGDMDFAKREWSVIQRHLAWEQRSFRRTYGPDKLPLYEAYAAIWASDDLEYDGGGTAHASAYNYFHNLMAARLAKAFGDDPTPYQKEADLIAKAMRQYLWLPQTGNFAEFRDYLGNQLPHESAALWSVYHTIDSQVPTPIEAWQMTRYLDTQLPHIPVRGPGVPTDRTYALLPTSTWMPYLWSINNVCMNENNATALAYFQAGRPDEGTRLLKSGILASMFMGIAPGNAGTMTYLDVYRRESQRDFGDASGTLSRTLVEGLFGIHPDALAGTLTLAPGFPGTWDHAAINHPELAFSWKRTNRTDAFAIAPRFSQPQALRLEVPVNGDGVPAITVNGQPQASWTSDPDAVGYPRLILTLPPAARWEITIAWAGKPLVRSQPVARVSSGDAINLTVPGADFRVPDLGRAAPAVKDPENVLEVLGVARIRDTETRLNGKVIGKPGNHTLFLAVVQGAFSWWLPQEIVIESPPISKPFPFDWSKPTLAAQYEPLDLSPSFNDNVTQIFKNQYRSPRSPFVSLAIPKQGLGAWAGEVNQTATIDDTGLRAAAQKNGGKIALPNGIPFATPSAGKNILFTSQFDNYPKEAQLPLTGKAKRIALLMAGSTNPMQSRFDNGEVLITYTDNTTARLALKNPDTWWPIEQDYFIDDYQFQDTAPLPPRINLRTGEVRLLDPATFKGKGGMVAGGAATVLQLPLDPNKELKSLTVRTLANEVVIGLMAATLER